MAVDIRELQRSPLLENQAVLKAFAIMTATTSTAAVASATMHILSKNHDAGEVEIAWIQYNEELLQKERLTTHQKLVAKILHDHEQGQVEYAISWMERILEKHIVETVQCEKELDPRPSNMPGLEGYRERPQPGVLFHHGLKDNMWTTNMVVPWALALAYIDTVIREDIDDEGKVQVIILQGKGRDPLAHYLQIWLKDGSLVLDD